jgi:HlyD family secretion protein
VKRSTLFSGIALALVLLGSAAWTALRPREPVHWRTARLERGEVVRKVTATGTVGALVSVAVGTQVSGVVTELHADFNSIVRKGELVARIDPAVPETQLADARAALRKARTAFDHARADLERNQRLAAHGLLAPADLETKATALESAQGDLDSAQAAVAKARINLGYCSITAPVDGVVTYRAVDLGQTVAASFSTPSLFTIAQDLHRMKVQAAIDEADIGQIQEGQEAGFTVDSYPGLAFHGKVREIQLNPTVSSNVVTYNVVMEVANVPRPGRTAGASDGRRYRGELALFPGMTANVAIFTASRKGVLRVPNLALRFNPGFPGPPGDKLWILEGGSPRPVPVTVAVAGSQFSEVAGAGLREGLLVVVGKDGPDSAPAVAAANPVLGAAGPGGPPPPH